MFSPNWNELITGHLEIHKQERNPVGLGDITTIFSKAARNVNWVSSNCRSNYGVRSIMTFIYLYVLIHFRSMSVQTFTDSHRFLAFILSVEPLLRLNVFLLLLLLYLYSLQGYYSKQGLFRARKWDIIQFRVLHFRGKCNVMNASWSVVSCYLCSLHFLEMSLMFIFIIIFLAFTFSIYLSIEWLSLLWSPPFPCWMHKRD